MKTLTLLLAITLVSLCLINSASAAISDGLLGEWSMDTSMNDSLNVHNGSVVGTITHNTNGGVGNTGYYTGTFTTSDYLTIPHANSLNLDIPDYTISLWMNSDYSNAVWVNKFLGDFTTNGGVPTGFYLRDIASNTEWGEYQDGSTFIERYYSPTPDNGAWTKITLVVTDNGTNWTFYKNTTIIGSSIETPVRFNTTAPIVFGIWSWNGGNNYIGGFDQFSMWNRALSSAEVTTAYNCEINGTSLSTCGATPPPSAPVNYTLTLTMNDTGTNNPVSSFCVGGGVSNQCTTNGTIYTFELSNNTYNVSYNSTGYISSSQNVIVAGNTAAVLQATPTPVVVQPNVTVTFKVNDTISNVLLNDFCTTIIGNVQKCTNSSTTSYSLVNNTTYTVQYGNFLNTSLVASSAIIITNGNETIILPTRTRVNPPPQGDFSNSITYIIVLVIPLLLLVYILWTFIDTTQKGDWTKTAKNILLWVIIIALVGLAIGILLSL